MRKTTQDLHNIWYKRLREDLPQQPDDKRQGILQWLLNGAVTPDEQLEYRYRILRQRYLMADSRQGYRLLITRLSSLMMGLSVARTWMKHSGISDQDMLCLLQKLVQKLVDHDPQWQQEVKQMTKFTKDSHLRQALVLASLEAYCLHPVNGQPLFLHLLRESFRYQLETPGFQGSYSSQQATVLG